MFILGLNKQAKLSTAACNVEYNVKYSVKTWMLKGRVDISLISAHRFISHHKLPAFDAN